MPTPGFETDPRYGQKTLMVYAPSQVHAGPARALVLLLHGTAGSPLGALQQARNVRTFWQPLAEQEQIVLVAPTASGNSGGWLAPVTAGDRPTDYDAMAAALDFAESRYNINRNRVYVWGFSSGGHVALDIGLNQLHATLTRYRFAAFAVSAGVMEGLSCPPNDEPACRMVAETAAPFPLSTLVGDTDPLLPRARSDTKRLITAGWSIRAGTLRAAVFPGGHTILADHPEWHWRYLGQFWRAIDKTDAPDSIIVPRSGAEPAAKKSR
ncbi:MAG: alpha/beta fold hydrolase [Ahniella sp.]|nr:alpha/beta fold hydrolase [Ahniella sp.]